MIGLGVYYGVEEILSNKDFCAQYHLELGLKGKHVIIQGIGNVGYWAAKFFEAGGATITGLVEWNGAIYNPDGINVDDASDYFKKNKSFKDYTKAKEVKGADDRMDVMYKECDIVIPAAIENTITKYCLCIF